MDDQVYCAACKQPFDSVRAKHIHEQHCTGKRVQEGAAPPLPQFDGPVNDLSSPATATQQYSNQDYQKQIEQLTARLNAAEQSQSSGREQLLMERIRQLEAEIDELNSKGLALSARPTKPPLERLGPLQTKRNVKVKIRALESVIPSGAGNNGTMYEITGPSKVLKLCNQLNLPTLGTISPVGEITLPAEARDSANIPQNATLFAFAYPLAGMGQLSEDQTKHINLGDLAHAFLSFGGYVYFDANGKALVVNAIDAGPGLWFDGPHKLHKTTMVTLQKQGRMQPVTAGFLRTTGARNFCWIRPGEPLPNLPVPCTNGAFAYDYGGDGADNRYFRVIESSDITPAMQDAWNLLSTGDDDGPPEPVSGAVAAQLCSICTTNAVNCVFLPCKHMTVCKLCSDTTMMCPVVSCSKPIKMKIEVYR